MPDRFHPSAIAQAYREEYPGQFDDISDTSLIKALEELDPETYRLIDPGLIGAEGLTTPGPATFRRVTPPAPAPRLLPGGEPADPSKPYPLPTPPPAPSWLDVGVTSGMRIVPAVGGAILGGLATTPSVVGIPAGVMAGGAAGAGLGETAAQAYEKRMGLREAINPATIAFESALGTVNPAARAASLTRRVVGQAGYGAMLGGGGVAGRSLIEEGAPPSLEQVAIGTVLGAGFAASTQSAAEGLTRLYRATRPSVSPDLPTAQKAKSYLEELATAQVGMEEVARMRAGFEATLAPPPPPPPGVAGLLPERAGPGTPPPGPIRAYPPGVSPELELVGAGAPPASRVIGGRDVGAVQPPPRFEEVLESSLQQPPGPPRLVRPLELSSQPPAAPVPRGIPELLPPPRPSAEGPILQGARVGGRLPTPEQPRLERVLEPGAPRPYATGPNAGPRRPPRQEPHGQPRPLRRQVRTGRTISYETVPARLTAEDPGTYPPEVRRELAAMAWELEQFPHEKVPGGLSTTAAQEIADREGISISQAIARLRAEGATAGGAIAGAPVYHDVLEVAQGSFPSHVKRAEMLRHLRTALLEGKGNGLTDAAAQVARHRLAERAVGLSGRSRILAQRGDEGDPLIGWVDESGARALPEQDLDEFTRAARDAETGELLTAYRFRQTGAIPEESLAFYDAATDELVRRGVITPEQQALTMEGPGGAGGPRLFDVEGEGPPGPPDAPEVRAQRAAANRRQQEEILREQQPARELQPPPSLPLAGGREPNVLPSTGRNAAGEGATFLGWQEGLEDVPDIALYNLEGGPRHGSTVSAQTLESMGIPIPETPPNLRAQPARPGAVGVRGQEIPTPPVPEAPGAPTPPPAAPVVAPRTGNLLTDLLREEGVLIFDIPAGDRTGLRRWLSRQEKQHGGEAWFNRVEQAVDEGNWDRAFSAAAAASARSYATAYQAARTPGAQRAIEAAVRGTPLQADIGAEIIGGARQRAGVGTAPPARGFPPSPRVTQAGAARGRARLGPAGILEPGPPQRPLSTTAPELRAATLDRAVVRLIMEGVEHPEGIATIPGNTDTYLRLFRQVGEQIYKGQNLKLLREAGMRIPPEALAQHWNRTISDAGRTLNLLSQFAQTHREVLTEAAERISMGGALRGMIRGEGPPAYVGARGRVASPAGHRATQEAVDEIAQRTSRYQAAAMANDLQKRSEIGPLRALHDSSYGFMLSKWNTAVRNYISFTGRYGVDSLDHALTIPLAQLTGDTPTAQLSSALLKERGLTPFRAGTSVVPWKGGKMADLQGIYDFTIDNLDRLGRTDARRAIRLLLDVPDTAAHFLGRATGEDLAAISSTTPVLRHLVNPKVQRFLTMFNRAQEFSARATVFDATTRALLRARGLDPTTTLSRSTPEIVEAVGGQQAFEDLLFTATAQSLEATFAGRTSKDSLPGALIRFINDAWPLKLGMPFPRFNLSAAPRWIYDHSPAALLDLVRFPLDRAGLTAPKGTVAGGRLYRGVRAHEIVRDELPALQLRIGQAERRQGEALQELLGTQREWQVRQRQLSRLTTRAQPGLPDTQTALQRVQDLQSQLGRRRERLKSQIQESSTVVKDLTSEQQKLLARVTDATAINAPNYAQFLARMSVGTVGVLGAAWVVRAQEGAQGTRWYEYRVDRGEGKDPIILDFRPFAPFAQYLFVADVLQDFWTHTNWEAAQAQAGEEGIGPGGALAWTRAIWENYEGKYTGAELGSQFAQAFLSISRAAGTTLTLTDLLTQNGWPSLEDAGRALVGTVGQFLSRFTIPGQQISDIGISPFSEEEAKIRTPPKATIEEWGRPLAAPIANIPGVRRLIPERISQTTGQPVAAEYPFLRGLLGIGTAPRDFVVEEVRRIGVPGSSVYIRETGDYGLDRLIAETYARTLQEFLPEVLEAPEYAEFGTPALQRDYLQRYIFPAIKRASLAEVQDALGTERFEEATVQGEEARRRTRQQRLLDRLLEETPELEGAGEEEAGALTAPPPPPSAF